MKDFIREKLLEAIKSRHWDVDSYTNRILASDLIPLLGYSAKSEIDSRISFVRNLEFDTKNPKKLGIWLYDSNVTIKHPPFSPRDKGKYLLAIVNGNTMVTMYWKHIKEGVYDYSINYDDLVRFSNSNFYDGKNNPISVENIKFWYDLGKP